MAREPLMVKDKNGGINHVDTTLKWYVTYELAFFFSDNCNVWINLCAPVQKPGNFFSQRADGMEETI